MGKAMAEGEDNAGDSGGDVGVGRHSEVVGEEGVVAQCAVVADADIAALVGGQMFHLRDRGVRAIDEGAILLKLSHNVGITNAVRHEHSLEIVSTIVHPARLLRRFRTVGSTIGESIDGISAVGVGVVDIIV